ncbi:MAG: DNA-processing protein DprA [Bacteroidales bacterium]|nr:DNA-processing protein DprA [Candidatus Cacconaster merdequi]
MEFDFYVCLAALAKVFAYDCAAGRRLLAAVGDVRMLFSLSVKDVAGIMGGGESYADMLLDPGTLRWAESEVKWALSKGVRIIGMDDPAYPYRLKECPDAPIVLYCSGSADLNPVHSLAVVGTRKATYSGTGNCRKIVGALAQTVPDTLVVSGLALGIDGVAHRSALENGLPTAAVLPCGLDEIYPARHRELAERIVENGVLVTDFCRQSAPVRTNFLRRNRIIAGMADAVLVVESFSKGGSLMTASLANSYSREVFAVPGRLEDESFVGCNRLIESDMARIVASPDSLGTSLGWSRRSKGGGFRSLFSSVEDGSDADLLLSSLRKRSPASVEELVNMTGLAPSAAAAELTALEMSGIVVAVPGGKFALAG